MSTISGASSELLFRYECTKRNIVPSIPDTDIMGYDVIVHCENNLYKIQIKSTSFVRGKSYKVNSGKNKYSNDKYTKNHADFFAMHIVPINIWYIIPVEEISVTTINLYPEDINNKYYQFKSAWHLLAS
jgi:hypothetical protein